MDQMRVRQHCGNLDPVAVYTTLSFMFRPKELPFCAGKKLYRRSVIEAGGHDLFMNVTITGHSIDSAQTEVSATGSSAYATLVARQGFLRRAGRRRGCARLGSRPGAEMNDLRRLGHDLDVSAGRGCGECLFPNQLAQFGVHGIQGVCVGQEREILKPAAGDQTGI